MRVDGRDYWRCGACEATWVDPRHWLDEESEAAHYRLHRNDPADRAYRHFLSRVTQPLLQRLAPGARGLDYGCGPGPALAAMMEEAGHTMALYDPLFAPCSEALKKQYDFITCTEVAEHFRQPAQEFGRLHALLRPGGWLGLMTTFMVEDEAFARWHYRRDPTHIVFYRPATFGLLARRHGWVCEFPAANVVLLHKEGP